MRSGGWLPRRVTLPSRPRGASVAWLATLLLLSVASAAAAQEAAGGAGDDADLVFEREVFFYEPAGRRDPLTPLTGQTGLAPRFSNLSLQGVIYSDTPGESVAILADRAGRVYRVRAGEVLGDARVLTIARDRVRFAVTSFGLVRQEELVLPSPGESAALAAQATAAAGGDIAEDELADEELDGMEDDDTFAADAAGVEP